MFKGIFKKGENTTKEYHIKKYVDYMKKDEKEAIINYAKNIDKFKLSKHVINKGITFDTKIISDTLVKCDERCIIEYTKDVKNNNNLIVFRSIDKQYVDINGVPTICYLHFVIYTNNNLIVSAWYREKKDSFKKPNFKHNYSKYIKVEL